MRHKLRKKRFFVVATHMVRRGQSFWKVTKVFPKGKMKAARALQKRIPYQTCLVVFNSTPTLRTRKPPKVLR